MQARSTETCVFFISKLCNFSRDRSSENDNHSGYSYQNGVHDASQNHHRLSTNLLSDKSPDYSSSPFAQQGTSYDLSESAETPTQEQEQEDDDSDNSSSRLHRRRGGLKNSGSAPSAKSSNSEPPDKKESESPSNKYVKYSEIHSIQILPESGDEGKKEATLIILIRRRRRPSHGKSRKHQCQTC